MLTERQHTHAEHTPQRLVLVCVRVCRIFYISTSLSLSVCASIFIKNEMIVIPLIWLLARFVRKMQRAFLCQNLNCFLISNEHTHKQRKLMKRKTAKKTNVTITHIQAHSEAFPIIDLLLDSISLSNGSNWIESFLIIIIIFFCFLLAAFCISQNHQFNALNWNNQNV